MIDFKNYTELSEHDAKIYDSFIRLYKLGLITIHHENTYEDGTEHFIVIGTKEVNDGEHFVELDFDFPENSETDYSIFVKPEIWLRAAYEQVYLKALANSDLNLEHAKVRAWIEEIIDTVNTKRFQDLPQDKEERIELFNQFLTSKYNYLFSNDQKLYNSRPKIRTTSLPEIVHIKDEYFDYLWTAEEGMRHQLIQRTANKGENTPNTKVGYIKRPYIGPLYVDSNNRKYYVPFTSSVSENVNQPHNQFPLYTKDGKDVGKLRFEKMIPVADADLEDYPRDHLKGFLGKLRDEYDLIMKNIDTIKQNAQATYFDNLNKKLREAVNIERMNTAYESYRINDKHINRYIEETHQEVTPEEAFDNQQILISYYIDKLIEDERNIEQIKNSPRLSDKEKQEIFDLLIRHDRETNNDHDIKL